LESRCNTNIRFRAGFILRPFKQLPGKKRPHNSSHNIIVLWKLKKKKKIIIIIKEFSIDFFIEKLAGV
jgi:hypothetical protein